jgi:hypothetical protein
VTAKEIITKSRERVEQGEREVCAATTTQEMHNAWVRTYREVNEILNQLPAASGDPKESL